MFRTVSMAISITSLRSQCMQFFFDACDLTLVLVLKQVALKIYLRIYVFEKGAIAMSQITLYLDDATQALVEQAAQAHGLSKSRWVAEIIRKYASHEWPRDCLELAGRFADFPLREAGPADPPADMLRLGF